jgi:hypothetical protein
MFLFLKLLLAHFVGDFVLQFDEVYKVKQRGFHGALIHYFIIILSFILFTIPFLGHWQVWLVIIVNSLVHIIQDEIKLRMSSSSKGSLVGFILDQLVHISFLCLILLFPFGKPLLNASPLAQAYNNDYLTIFLIGYIVSVYAGAYFWESFRFSYFKQPALPNAAYIKYGMFERFVFTTAAVMTSVPKEAGLWLFLFLVPLIFRASGRRNIKFGWDFGFNLIYAVIVGAILKNFIPTL